LASISADHRAVIVMREVEGLRYEQIADVLGVSKGTVMSRLHYARKKLQQMLGDMLNYRDAESSKELSANFQSVK
jgi:RNA polymerase sigma-70 factor (ECF subfamily)